MEDVNTVIIPTRVRDKIPHDQSFPIGAERISIALASATQLPLLVLDFRSDRYKHVRLGHLSFFSVTYSGKDMSRVNSLLRTGVPLFNKWTIGVRPVSRTSRHFVQQYILETALPRVKGWLDQRIGLEHPGVEAIEFFFDEGKEEFVEKQEARRQPMRESNPKSGSVNVESPKAASTKKDPRP